METKIVKIDKENPDKEKIKEAAKLLKKGKLVVFPTETVYGLGVNAFMPEAIKKVFVAKQRPAGKPLTLHIADQNDVQKIASSVPEKARLLMEKFWPGPLTIVLEKRPEINDEVTAGSKTVGIRMPDHKVALALIKEAGVPIAAPSANISGNAPATDAEEAKRELNGLVDMIIDAGKTEIGISSTVIDLTKEPPVLLRQGSVSRQEIEEAIGKTA